jgi:hypothetical protein
LFVPCLDDERAAVHRRLIEDLIVDRGEYGQVGRKKKVPPVDSTIIRGHVRLYSPADAANEESARAAEAMAVAMRSAHPGKDFAEGEKRSGAPSFEVVVADYVRAALGHLGGLRVGSMKVLQLVQRGQKPKPTGSAAPTRSATIGTFHAYRHLWYLTQKLDEDEELRAAFGGDYLIRPDVIVWIEPLDLAVLNASRKEPLLSDTSPAGTMSPVVRRGGDQRFPILHASISCKETLRSDRAQNARTEALNLLRNRKGRAPHIVLVTAEPLPSRLASIAQGTGDVDCVYHVALPELRAGVAQLNKDDPAHWAVERRILEALSRGGRLRDLSDLPLDLLL